METQMRSASECCSTHRVPCTSAVQHYAFSSRRAARCFSQLHGQQRCHSAFRLPPKQTCRCSPDDRPGPLCTRPSRGVELPESSDQPPALQSWQLDQSVKALGFAAALCTALLLVPNSADAAEALPLDILAAFLAKVQALGPWGPCLFVLTVICCEMIPLFPTQPLALSSGLLFGPYEGSVCTIIATTLAASLAFSLSQGVGRRFAERMVDSEVKEGSDGGNAIKRALGNVQESIDKGSFWQQFSAVLALRMTPVVPFSASSYLLGLTPLPFKPFFSGTLAAMSLWGPLYASIGAASRALLTNGSDIGELLADLQSRTGAYTEKVAIVGLGAGVLVLVLYFSGVIDASTEGKSGQ